MTLAADDQCRNLGGVNQLPKNARVRAFVESVAKRRILITYRGLVNGLQMLRPIPSIGSGSPGASEWRGAGAVALPQPQPGSPRAPSARRGAAQRPARPDSSTAPGGASAGSTTIQKQGRFTPPS
jgi:hypothetical protein